MGDYYEHDFDAFILAVADRLKLTQAQPSAAGPPQEPCLPDATAAAEPRLTPNATQMVDVPGVPPRCAARLFTYDFVANAATASDAKPALKVSYLLWSSVTNPIKQNIEQGVPSSLFANAAKGFIASHLGDVVLYGGWYRETVLRPTIEAGLCRFVGGTPSVDGKTCESGDFSDPTVIITHSLGGYMLMDALDDELRRNTGKAAAFDEVAAKVINSTHQYFMMANQLSLIDLTLLCEHDYTDKKSNGRDFYGETCLKGKKGGKSMLDDRFAGHVHDRRNRKGGGNPMQIVAFNDPNDILTYRVYRSSLEIPEKFRGDVSLSNVYLSNNEFTIPHVFSDPVAAHNGYFENNAVLQLLVCGMKRGMAAPCPVDRPR